MTISERATQIWPVLKLAATNRQILTYGMLSDLVGVPRQGLGRCLDPIQNYCLEKGLPPLTILVVSKESGMPGEGFIAAEDIPEQQARVFEHNWLDEMNPMPADFEAVQSKR